MKQQGILVIHGPCGTGKTYFCAAMLERIPKNCMNVRCYSERSLFQKIRNWIQSGVTGDYLLELRDAIDDDFIIIDDVGSSGHNQWREEVLLEAIDYRYNLQKPTIITSNLNQQEFKEIYGNRITSRLFAKENTIIDYSQALNMREVGK